MDITLLAEHIGKYVGYLTKIIPLHAQVPVLSNILIEVNETSLSLSATNLELAIVVKIPAKIEKTGAVTVPGKEFVDVVNSIQKGKIRIYQEGEKLVLAEKGNTVVFQTIPKEEFPTLFEQKGEKKYTFTTQEFKDIFSHLTFVCSLDDSRPTLQGVFFTQKENALEFVATDGFRMALRSVTGAKIFEKEEGAIISSKLLNEVLALREGESIDMYIHEAGNQVIFESQQVTYVGRVIEGKFPNYEKVIPELTRTKVTLEREEFMQAIRLISVFARESANIVHLKLNEGVMTLQSKSSGVGEGEVKVDVAQDGEDTEIAFNVKFLLDLLKSLSDKRIIMELNTGLDPAMFKREADENFLHIIMPVRVQE